MGKLVKHRFANRRASLALLLYMNKMDISGLSYSGLIALAQSLKASKLQEQVGTAVMKMANKQAEQQSENALQFIEAWV